MRKVVLLDEVFKFLHLGTRSYHKEMNALQGVAVRMKGANDPIVSFVGVHHPVVDQNDVFGGKAHSLAGGLLVAGSKKRQITGVMNDPANGGHNPYAF